LFYFLNDKEKESSTSSLNFKASTKIVLKFCEISILSLNFSLSIKMVPPSKRSVSDAELAPYMLCCLVHVSKKKPHVQGLNWWKRKKSSFHFSNAIFSAFPFLSLFYPYLPPSNFSQTHQNSLQPFSFPLNVHHLLLSKIIIIAGEQRWVFEERNSLWLR